MKKTKKFTAVILSIALVCANLGYVHNIKAESGTKNVILTPYEGQWKYYGQSRTFLENEHYTLSDNIDLADVNWKLTLAGEEVGYQSFVFEYEVENKVENKETLPDDSVNGSNDEESGENDSDAEENLGKEETSIMTGTSVAGDGYVLTIAENAPRYMIRKYTTTAKVEDRTQIYTTTASQTIEAPKGYLISKEKVNGEWDWQEQIETGELQEGNNIITYYLRSVQQNNTKYAIDQTPKTITIKVDSVAPTVTELFGGINSTDVYSEGSIAGSENGKYYYMVLPTESLQEVTKDVIKENVENNYGIVGYGRLNGVSVTDLQFNNLTPETSYTIYAFLVDEAGNESEFVESEEFTTSQMYLNGKVQVAGKVEVGQTLTAQTEIISVDPGKISYQWYRVKLDADEELLDKEYDITGSNTDNDTDNDADDEEADDSSDEGDDSSDEGEELNETEDADTTENKSNTEEVDITTLDSATLINGATTSTYKITKEDIGYRILVQVTVQNYTNYIVGDSEGFVPKLIPAYTKPILSVLEYSPTRTLASYKLPNQWSWVDDSIVPEYGNFGYRAKFTPKDTEHYRSLVVNLPISVTKKSLKKKMFTVSETKTYTGSVIKNNFKAKDGKTKLVNGKDFSVTYKNNKKVGKATIVFKGKGNYKETIKVSYLIKRCSVKNLSYSYETKKVYECKPINAKITIFNNDNKLKKDKDYTIEYSNNVEVGKATIVIKGIGNYYGKKTIHFKIVPKKPIINKVKVKGKTITIAMKEKSYTKGFYVYISTMKSFEKENTQVYVAYNGKLGLKNMKKGKYYVRLQAFWNRDGKVYVSGYSKIKKAEVK